jgi:hypothetical protein
MDSVVMSARDRNPPLNKGFSATAALYSHGSHAGSLAPGVDAKPPRPAALVASQSLRGLSSTGPLPPVRNRDVDLVVASDAAASSPGPGARMRASSATPLRSSSSMADLPGRAYPPASPAAQGGIAGEFSMRIDGGMGGGVGRPVPLEVESPSRRRPYSAALTSPAATPASGLGLSSTNASKRSGHGSTAQRLSSTVRGDTVGQGSGGGSGSGGGLSTVSRFLTPDELAAADIDKRELLQEWLACFEKEDDAYTSAVLAAEVKMRCVVWGEGGGAGGGGLWGRAMLQ